MVRVLEIHGILKAVTVSTQFIAILDCSARIQGFLYNDLPPNFNNLTFEGSGGLLPIEMLSWTDQQITLGALKLNASFLFTSFPIETDGVGELKVSLYCTNLVAFVHPWIVFY
jgi:hypothetical protein